MDRVGVGGGVGGTKWRGLWGKGAVGRVCRSSFLAGGQNRAGGPEGSPERRLGAGCRGPALGIPASPQWRLCLTRGRGGGGAAGRRFGGSRGACTPEGRHHSPVTPLFVRGTPRVSLERVRWGRYREWGLGELCFLKKASGAQLGLRSVNLSGSRRGLVGQLLRPGLLTGAPGAPECLSAYLSE